MASPAAGPGSAPAAPPPPAAPPAPALVEAAQRIRPIPNKVTQKGLGLPGVGKPSALPGVVDTLPDEAPAEDSGVQDAAPATDLGQPPLVDEGPAPEAQPAEGDPAIDPATGGPWLSLDLGEGIGKAEFRDQDHLVQNLKTLRGQYRTFQRDVQDARNEAGRLAGMLQGIGIDPSTGQLINQPPGAAAGAPQAPQSQPPTQPLSLADVTKELDEAVDYRVVQDLLKRNPAEALAYVQMQNGQAVAKLIAEKIPAFIEARLAPLQEQAERARGMSQVSQFWSQARAAQDADGNPVFPEMQNPQGMDQLARVWTAMHSEMGLPMEFLMSPMGLQTAAMYLRSAQGGGQAAASAAPPSPAQAVTAQVRQAVAQRANGQSAAVLSPAARPSTPSPTARPADPRKAVAAAIMAAGPDRTWGVNFE